MVAVVLVLLAPLAVAGAENVSPGQVWSEEDIVTQRRPSELAFGLQGQVVWVGTTLERTPGANRPLALLRSIPHQPRATLGRPAGPAVARRLRRKVAAPAASRRSPCRRPWGFSDGGRASQPLTLHGPGAPSKRAGLLPARALGG